jgi:lysophospholipase L1-like esterase
MSRLFRVVYMGDSITFGQYVAPSLRWTTLIDERLRAEFGGTTPIETFNRGVSGETTRLGLERFPTDLQAFRPDLITLQFGMNDCNCWDSDEGLPRVSPAAFRANLTEMVERARRFGAREVIMATNHRTLRKKHMPSGEEYEDANGRYNEILREVAAEASCRLCDVHAVFDAMPRQQLVPLLLPAPDLLHLSGAGNRVYADLMWPHLREGVVAALPATESAR